MSDDPPRRIIGIGDLKGVRQSPSPPSRAVAVTPTARPRSKSLTGRPVSDISKPASEKTPLAATGALQGPSNAKTPEKSSAVVARSMPSPPPKKALSPGQFANLKAAREALRERWPAAFDGEPRPLAVGIGNLIQAELASSFPRWAISTAIRARTQSRRYLEATVNGTVRVGLDGEPDGTVAEDERQYAIEQLDAKYPGWRA